VYYIPVAWLLRERERKWESFRLLCGQTGYIIILVNFEDCRQLVATSKAMAIYWYNRLLHGKILGTYGGSPYYRWYKPPATKKHTRLAVAKYAPTDKYIICRPITCRIE